jgi:hypothetical protein
MKKEVNQIAVENFLSSLDKEAEAWIHYGNARLDARLYKWNMPTLNAILRGIFRMYAKK